jgi:hypothetical protein
MALVTDFAPIQNHYIPRYISSRHRYTVILVYMFFQIRIYFPIQYF